METNTVVAQVCALRDAGHDAEPDYGNGGVTLYERYTNMDGVTVRLGTHTFLWEEAQVAAFLATGKPWHAHW